MRRTKRSGRFGLRLASHSIASPLDTKLLSLYLDHFIRTGFFPPVRETAEVVQG